MFENEEEHKMPELTTVLDNSVDMKTRWELYHAYPYARAFAKALSNYKETGEAQKKLDAEKTELCMMALTICSGGVLTHVFAQTTWKAVAVAKTLDVICKNNMNQAFAAAHFVSSNKVANFIVGGLWDAGGKILEGKTKKLFEETRGNFPSTQKWTTETDALTSLVQFVGECFLKYRDTARHIFANSKLTTAQRDAAIATLTSSKFAKAPKSSQVNEKQLAKEIELLMYLRMIQDLDYTQTWTHTPSMGMHGGSGMSYGQKKSIDMSPDDSKYPKSHSKMGKGVFASSSGMSIGYKDLGKSYYNKINKLYGELFGSKLLDSAWAIDFFNATIDKKAFNAAHGAIKRLGMKGLQRFNATLTG